MSRFRDWTKNEAGVVGESKEYLILVDVVMMSLLHSGDDLVRGRVLAIAKRIVYRLVHECDVGPFDAVKVEIEQTAYPAHLPDKDVTNEELDELALERSR